LTTYHKTGKRGNATHQEQKPVWSTGLFKKSMRVSETFNSNISCHNMPTDVISPQQWLE
jgi:hypothetical protein